MYCNELQYELVAVEEPLNVFELPSPTVNMIVQMLFPSSTTKNKHMFRTSALIRIPL